MIARLARVSGLVPGTARAALVVMLAFLGGLIASSATSDRPAMPLRPAAPPVRHPDNTPAPPAVGAALKTEPALATTRSSAGLVLFGVLAIGGLAWWRRRRTVALRPEASFELVAQTGLGGRARALWMRAGQRELLIAVTPQSVQLLDRWSRPAPLPGPSPDADADADAATEAALKDQERSRDRDRSSVSASDSDSDPDFRAELRSARRSLRSRRHSRARARLSCPRGAQEPR